MGTVSRVVRRNSTAAGSSQHVQFLRSTNPHRRACQPRPHRTDAAVNAEVRRLQSRARSVASALSFTFSCGKRGEACLPEKDEAI